MTHDPAGRPRGAAHLIGLLLLLMAHPVASDPVTDRLVIETRDGSVLGYLPLGPDQEICLTWSHSVTGGRVADCFENWAGKMVLTRSYLHDVAAGLGEVVGRGRMIPAADTGYWIIGIDEAIANNALQLRVGAISVDHVLRPSQGTGGTTAPPPPPAAASDDVQPASAMPSPATDDTLSADSIPLSRLAAGQSVTLRLSTTTH